MENVSLSFDISGYGNGIMEYDKLIMENELQNQIDNWITQKLKKLLSVCHQ